MINRRAFFACFCASTTLAQNEEKEKTCPVQVAIDSKDGISVTVPNMDKASLIDVAADFLGRGPDGKGLKQTEMGKALAKSKQFTLTLTTKCEK